MKKLTEGEKEQLWKEVREEFLGDEMMEEKIMPLDMQRQITPHIRCGLTPLPFETFIAFATSYTWERYTP
ncbi:hypothetical protein C5S53_10770 [Methanophagales archaeon]|nr:hypothetical protein C5S53_10770 [Methanophagales archaeon]